ncbi:MAG TPA: helix-turn-helix transcriptional regulator [Abditibacteriaceae bacterium]|jgi:AraC-like DNA-binding protein
MEDDLIILASSRTPDCYQILDKRLDSYATVQYMSQGAVRVAYDHTWHELTGSWFWPAYPGPRLRFRPVDAVTTWFHRHLGFRGPLFHRWVAAGLWFHVPQPAPLGFDWETFFDEMIDVSKDPGRLARLRTINMLENLLIRLAESRATSGQNEEWLRVVLDRLQITETAPVVDTPNYALIAHEAGMSEALLRRKFKDACGTSLHQFYLQARVASARNMLGETDLPIKAIAHKLGYTNVHFFSRQFRALSGVTPAQYRRSRL